MTDRPIIFSGPMIRALLDGRKRQTRRLQFDARGRLTTWGRLAQEWERGERDQWVWVREEWGMNHYKHEAGPIPKTRPRELDAAHFVYFATEDDPEINDEMRRRPSIHQPRWASRITLTVTDVRVQRLQEISEADAIAEGATSRNVVIDFGGMSPGWCMDWSRIGQPWPGDKSRSLRGHDIALGSARMAFASFWNEIHGGTGQHGEGPWDANPWVVAITFTVDLRNIDAKGAA